MNKILLVEDSPECQIVVKHSLESSQNELSITNDRQETQALLKKRGALFDMVILDLMLPDGDGFEVLKDLKSAGLPDETPIFFLTSRDELESKVFAFNLGADDYLVKPISPIELKARVEMRLKKNHSLLSDTIVKGDLILEMKSIRASRLVNQQPVDLSLTAKEFKLLSFLVQNENQVFSRSKLVEAGWGPNIHILDRTVDSHICGLRKKMGPLAFYIESEPGSGYKFSGPRQTTRVS